MLEIGRYDLLISSVVAEHERVWVVLKKTPVLRDKLHKWQMIGAMYGASCLSSHDGAGSNSHDLAGAFLNKHKVCALSGTVAGLKQLIEATPGE